MVRLVLLAMALPILGLTLQAAGEPSPIPKDTLPAKLLVAEVPLGLAPRPVPTDNPLTEARVQLGRKLFFDPILSADQSVACASCHQPKHGFASAEARPRGIRGQQLARRAPTLFNRAYGTAFFWDGRVGSLEEQALRPIEDPAEMGSTVADTVQRLRTNPQYAAQFATAFDDGVTATNLARALAGFQRVLLRGNSRVDRFRRNGEHAALSPEERSGLWLYESKARCWRCHTGANFTDEGFHNTGVSWDKEPADLGRYAVTKKDEDRGKFKTPTLRGVGLATSYMHDGSMRTLEEVIEFYNRGGIANPNRDPGLAPLGLSTQQMRDLVAFLKAL
jgi:cytochrome c peroxidase